MSCAINKHYQPGQVEQFRKRMLEIESDNELKSICPPFMMLNRGTQYHKYANFKCSCPDCEDNIRVELGDYSKPLVTFGAKCSKGDLKDSHGYQVYAVNINLN